MKLSVEDIAALGPMTMEEMLMILDGVSPEQAKARTKLNAELHAEGEQYRNAPPSQWPTLVFNWDFSPEGQRYALDGVRAAEFQRSHPKGLRLGWVNLVEFDSKLCHFNRRDEGEIWSVGDDSKLSRAIAYLQRGLPISPPLVGPVEGKDELRFIGGNHRYAALKVACRETEFPMYVDPDDFEAVARIVTVRSAPAG